MSIRHGLLALLERGPRYGSQLRTEFESRTGSTWPLNVGQVYTTLARLERDGLVAPGGEDPAGHTLYAITDTGRAELHEWYERPVDRANPPRDELSIKLAMAVGAPGVDIRSVIQSQRHATIKAMQDYTRLKAQALTAIESGTSHERDDIAWLLVLEQLIFQTEAEARWLDHCEARLVRLSLSADRRAAPDPPQAAPTAPAAEATTAAGGTTDLPSTARTRRS
ncbi:PadR family transcriptional regulator [Streptomyces sp. NPDC060334]|uniref:PadR family transcriptional regulator n=1 Tax=unclassified Streptomyces TaxID=2593676 RepID=UPI0006AE66DA|nr:MULTISPECIES: PadR family transcriptional regulator [unclassified Streptomyces]KOU67693.1 PadR family transcriptional regulator [Streptomyces sp. WM4235]MCX5074536.1 PadR family transcriptional regulator [Streptomyces sp. NBC_00424]MCX5153935.1 PadR family transcriptional regulator [Streptomyces sp. NBC_00291]WUD42287.1 PadR family transcriptional regulator [Streptomyces sp. NBC_00513]